MSNSCTAEDTTPHWLMNYTIIEKDIKETSLVMISQAEPVNICLHNSSYMTLESVNDSKTMISLSELSPAIVLNAQHEATAPMKSTSSVYLVGTKLVCVGGEPYRW